MTFEKVPFLKKLNGLADPSEESVEIDRYFRYTIPEGINYDDHWVLLQVKPKSRLQVYMHWQRVPGPQKHQYEQMLGDLPNSKLEELLNSRYRMEYFTDCKVFTYNDEVGKVEYQRTHEHIDQTRFADRNYLKCDGDLLAALTTWTPEKVSPPMGYTKTSQSAATNSQDQINFIFSTTHWKEISDQIKIGVHNSDPEAGPVDFSIKVMDFAPRDVYPDDVKVRSDIIDAAYQKIDVINTSWQERERKNLLGNRDFTYGEVKFHSMYPLLQMTDPQPGEVFYDLGCGTGLPSAVAALMFPQLGSSEGAEYIEIVAQMGIEAVNQVKQTCREQSVEMAPLSVCQGDIVELDWSHADIIICNNVTWGAALLEQVVQKATLLKDNTRFLSFIKLPDSRHMQLKHSLSVQMSWGSQPCFFYVVKNNQSND